MASADVDRELADCRRALRQIVVDWSRAEDEERHRVAAGLHDDVGQVLATMGLHVHAMRQWPIEPDRLALIDETRRLLDHAVESIRSLTFRLLAPSLDEGGLPVALAGLAERLENDGDIPCAFTSDGSGTSLDSETAAAAFRVVRELLANISKHSDASQAAVDIATIGDAVRITVTDDGRGFTPPRDSAPPELLGVGLLIARERTAQIGGRLEIDSAIGAGTRVVVVVPLTVAAGST